MPAAFRHRFALSLAALCVAASPLFAQRATGATAELEVSSDSVGQPIYVNGRRVAHTARTPVVVQVPAGPSSRVEVGNTGRARAVTMDIPAGGRILLDVSMPRDTQPLPMVRSAEDLRLELRGDARYAMPIAPNPPRRPKAPGLGRSVAGGLLIGAVAGGVSSALCEQTFNAPAPTGGYVGGNFYPPGSHSLGVSTPCIAMAAGTGLAAGAVTIHGWRRLRFGTARKAYGAQETEYARALLNFRSDSTARENALRAAVERELQSDRDRRRAVMAANDATIRSNRELPVVTFVNAPGVRAVGARTVLVPPSLRIAALTFRDADGDSRIGASERTTVLVKLRNEGRGAAYGVRVQTRVSGAEVRVLPVEVGTIVPGTEREVELIAAGTSALLDGTALLEVAAVEANGFDADPYELRVATLAYRPPNVIVADVAVADAEGRSIIRRGQAAQVTLRVHNIGEGLAEGVRVIVARGNANVFFSNAAAADSLFLEVGRLDPGAWQDLSVEVLTNARATDLRLSASVVEATGRYGSAPRDLGLTLDVPQRSVAQLTVPAMATTPRAAGASVLPALVSDLLERIPSAPRENPDAIAVIIGNRNYRNAPSVEFAANDAAVVQRYVVQSLGVRPGNVILLEDATLSELKRYFGDRGQPGRLRERVKPGVTELFVFYSGHGAPDVRSQGAYLMPVDADANALPLTGLSVETLYDNLAALDARHVTVVLDACFSGATGAGQMLIDGASPIGIQVTNPAARFSGERATIIAAAQGQQLANWYPEMRHGLLTYFFLKGLQGNADQNGDDMVSVAEMRAWLTRDETVPYTSRLLYGASREQMPQVWGQDDRVVRP